MSLNPTIKIGVESGVYDNFALSTYSNCQQAYHYRIERGLIKPSTRKTAAEFGALIHSSLEWYYKNGMTDEAISGAVEIFNDGFKEDPSDDKRTFLKGLLILDKYFKRYRHEPFNVVAVEVGGIFDLEGYGYSVRIDLVVEWMSPRGIYGFDHKTASSLTRMVAKPNNQITGYEAYLGEIYEDVIGFQLNCIGVYKDMEEIDRDAPKVPSSKTGKPVYAKKEKEIFQRIPTTRTIQEISQWKKETIHLIHQIEQSTSSKVWRKHAPEYCTAYASKCAYLDLCQAHSPEVVEMLIDSGIYQVVPWLPYAELAGEEEGG